MEVFLKDHFVTIMLIVSFSLKLASSRDARDSQVRYLWLSIICTALLVFQDIFETHCSLYPSLIVWRTILSVMGFVLRPVAALGLLLVVANRYPHRELLWMPAWINAAVISTAFFSPVAFYFDENYTFTRGPLGYCPFIVGFIYIVLVLIFLAKTYGLRWSWEGVALYWCALSTVLCVFVDALHGGTRLNMAIMISAIFYYIFIRSHDVNMDQLTGLLNRGGFYRDAETRGNAITAMADLDLMGLRELNETRGLRDADRILSDVGKCFRSVSDRHISCYRMGDGDFLMVFYGASEREGRLALQQAQTAIQGLGLHMSAGFVTRSSQEKPELLFQRARDAMRMDRIAYFQRPANNRRRRPEPGKPNP